MEILSNICEVKEYGTTSRSLSWEKYIQPCDTGSIFRSMKALARRTFDVDMLLASPSFLRGILKYRYENSGEEEFVRCGLNSELRQYDSLHSELRELFKDDRENI